MKKYFIVPDAALPAPMGDTQMPCVWHSIDLSSHGPAGDKWSLVCLEGDFSAPESWVKLPHVYDTGKKLKDFVDHQLLADIGVTGEENTLELTSILEDIHPRMGT